MHRAVAAIFWKKKEVDLVKRSLQIIVIYLTRAIGIGVVAITYEKKLTALTN